MKKRPDITEATRQRFVDAFCRLYAVHPVENITVKEIAAIAGHNRVTFYQYFHDPYEILESMENELIEHIGTTIERNVKKPNMFEGFEETFGEILEGKAELTAILLNGANNGRTLQRCKTAMRPVLGKAFHIDEDDVRSQAVLEFYLSGVVSLLHYKVRCGEKITTEDLGKIIKDILKNGVMPQLCTD